MIEMTAFEAYCLLGYPLPCAFPDTTHEGNPDCPTDHEGEE